MHAIRFTEPGRSGDDMPLGQVPDHRRVAPQTREGPAPKIGRYAPLQEQLALYLRKMRGTAGRSPPRVSTSEILWSWLGTFVGIGAVALVGRWFVAGTDNLMLIGSLGASAVLIYGAPRSPLAQPRNLVGGHILSALVGVFCFQVLHPYPGLDAAMAVASATALMHLTRTLHPPGGATALIAVIGSEKLHALGYLYVLAPAGLGALTLLAVGLLVNNANPDRRYPEFWL